MILDSAWSLSGKLEQVEVGIVNHDVEGLAAYPAAHVDVAVGAPRATRVDRQAHARVCFPAGAAPSTGDVERHRNEISQIEHLDIGALLDHLARDLVPEHHAGRGSRATADHVLVGSADIGGNHLKDHAMLDLAAHRILEFGVRDFLNLDFSGLDIDDAAISTHDKPLLQGGTTDTVSSQRIFVLKHSGTGRGVAA